MSAALDSHVKQINNNMDAGNDDEHRCHNYGKRAGRENTLSALLNIACVLMLVTIVNICPCFETLVK